MPGVPVPGVPVLGDPVPGARYPEPGGPVPGTRWPVPEGPVPGNPVDFLPGPFRDGDKAPRADPPAGSLEEGVETPRLDFRAVLASSEVQSDSKRDRTLREVDSDESE